MQSTGFVVVVVETLDGMCDVSLHVMLIKLRWV